VIGEQVLLAEAWATYKEYLAGMVDALAELDCVRSIGKVSVGVYGKNISNFTVTVISAEL
jgi:hypothetical protein